MSVRALALGLAALVAAGCATSAPRPARTSSAVPAASQTNRPPNIVSLSATDDASMDQTTYVITALDIDGDRLFFRWSNTNACGEFAWSQDSNVAVWSHKRPPCPAGPSLGGTITVEVADGRGGTARIEYPNGSASGIVTR